MVVCNLEGGWGNNAFQTAFIYSYAKKHNLDYCVYTKVNNPHIYDKGVYNLSAYRFPGINYCDDPPQLEIFNEPHFHYADIPKMDNVCFKGFWQSWKYFDDYREDVLKAFGFDKIETKKGICSIHYRATDYRDYQDYHPLISERYLKDAIIKVWFAGYKKFIVFSDDIPAIREIISTFGFSGNEFEYSEGRSEIEDLLLMASCESNITANSTFSLFAAYINPNPNKIIISPKNWFGPALKHNTKDLYLPGSIII